MFLICVTSRIYRACHFDYAPFLMFVCIIYIVYLQWVEEIKKINIYITATSMEIKWKGHSWELWVNLLRCLLPMTEKGLRLEGGEGSSIGNQTGRVSILQYGIWGRVCPNSWDDDDANVVCRMKGYLGGVAYKYTSQG